MTQEQQQRSSRASRDEAVRPDGRDLLLVRRLSQLHVPVVSDCLDRIGLRENTMATRIRPLAPGTTAAGYAATVRLVEVDGPPSDPDDYYRGELEALEAMQPGDVMVTSTCPGAYWGELLATACRVRGIRGLIADAYTRDTEALMRMEFPTFVAGISPQDSLGRTDVDAWNVPIACGGVEVRPGDLIIADHDGVAVIPASLGPEVVARGEAKLGAEADMRAALASGVPIGQAFRTHGVL